MLVSKCKFSSEGIESEDIFLVDVSRDEVLASVELSSFVEDNGLLDVDDCVVKVDCDVLDVPEELEGEAHDYIVGLSLDSSFEDSCKVIESYSKDVTL